MQSFLARHRDRITGVLSGFDRVVFRGGLRQLSYCDGLSAFLAYKGVLLRDFGDWAAGLTSRVVQQSEAVAEKLQRPFRYLQSSRARKEDVARAILEREPVDEGLICVLKCVEPCQSFEIHRSRERRKLELRSVTRKCAHLYHYFLHPRFGFMHVRTQTWLPFQVQVVINGREWLVQDLERQAFFASGEKTQAHAGCRAWFAHSRGAGSQGIDHERRDNCLASVEKPDRAQRLLDKQLRTNWPRELDGLARAANPAHAHVFRGDHLARYWTTHQLEWATDVMFDSSESLAELYPDLLTHAIRNLGSQDVLRFLQKKLTGHFQGEARSSLRKRSEGVRVKHFVNANSIKMYDKQGSVLRVETTINQVGDFKAYRAKEGDPGGERSWRRCRKGIADLHRVTQICHAANAAYLESAAAVDSSQELGRLLQGIVKPDKLGKQRIRGLRPWDDRDLALMKAVSRGEFLVHGFRNRDIVALLHPTPSRPEEAKRRSAAVGRLLRILRAHGLIRKLPRTHRYRVTDKGREVCAAVITAHAARVSRLLQAA